MAITDQQLRSKPTDVDQWFKHPFGRGAGVFEARITPSGERRFYFRAVASSGTRVRMALGAYDNRGIAGLTVADAYARAAELSRLYLSGVRDLKQHFEGLEADRQAAELAARARAETERQAAEVERTRRLTVRQLFERWIADLQPRIDGSGRRHGRKDGGKYLRYLFEQRLLPDVGAVPAADLRKADLMAVIDTAKADGRLRTANVLLGEVKTMLRFALVREIVERNVLDGVERKDAGGANVKRDRTLTDDEIKLLAARLPSAGLEPRSSIAVWLLLATGCRLSELLGAGWDQVDLAARTLYLPETKNQRDHTVHLSAFAVGHLQALADLRDKATATRRKTDPKAAALSWLFPNARGTAAVVAPSLGKQLADRQTTADRKFAGRTVAVDSLVLPNGRWTAHDLRRTLATGMARLGVHGHVIEEALNHKLQGVAAVYAHDRRRAEQAIAFDAWGAKLAELCGGKKVTSKVVRIRA